MKDADSTAVATQQFPSTQYTRPHYFIITIRIRNGMPIVDARETLFACSQSQESQWGTEEERSTAPL